MNYVLLAPLRVRCCWAIFALRGPWAPLLLASSISASRINFSRLKKFHSGGFSKKKEFFIKSTAFQTHFGFINERVYKHRFSSTTSTAMYFWQFSIRTPCISGPAFHQMIFLLFWVSYSCTNSSTVSAKCEKGIDCMQFTRSLTAADFTKKRHANFLLACF